MHEIHKLHLSEKSKLLMLYYKELQKNLKKYYSFSQNKNLKSEKKYINFQKYIFNKLDLCLDANLNLSKFRKFYYSQTSEYKNYVRKIYNSHFTRNKYITQETKDFIKNGENIRENCLLIYEIPYKNTKINFHFFIYNNVGISQKNMEYYDSKVLHMTVLINLITLLTENNNIYVTPDNKICSKDGLNVYLFLTPFERKLENIDKKVIHNNHVNKLVLGAKHCNGGFCYGCINAGEIIIYRFEEWFKVFSHECAHNFGVDNYIWGFMNQVNVIDSKPNQVYHNFLNKFNLGNQINNTNFDIGLQECIVEFWGEFLNNVIFSYNYSKSCILSHPSHSSHSTHSSHSSHSFKIYLSIFEKIANYELFHGLLQTTKILEYNDISFKRLLQNSQNSQNSKDLEDLKNPENNYRESSHLFSYYILKTLIIYNYKKFIISPFSLNQNKILFNNENKLENMEIFFNSIISNANDNKFNKIIKLIEDLYEFLREYKNCKKLNYIISNLRMSILEF